MSVRLPVNCTVDSDCVSIPFNTTLGMVSAEGHCRCGQNPTGTSYCTPFVGDMVEVNHLSKFKQWVTSGNILKCNTYDRFKHSCVKTYLDEMDYFDFILSYWHSMHYVSLINSAECTTHGLSYDYWRTVEDFTNYNPGDADDDDGFAGASVAVFLFLLAF
jgi:hypothetical protein